jgi:hypothetical protein
LTIYGGRTTEGKIENAESDELTVFIDRLITFFLTLLVLVTGYIIGPALS